MASRRLAPFFAPDRILPLVAGGIAAVLFGAFAALYAESPLPLLGILALLTFIVFLARDLTFYAMLVLWPFSFRTILTSGLELQTPTEPLLGMLVFVLFAKNLLGWVTGERGERSIGNFPFWLPVLGYAVVMFLPSFRAPNLFDSVKGATRAVAYMMLSFLTWELIRRRQHLRLLFAATFPSAAITVIWTVIVLIQHLDRWQWTSAYEGSPFYNYSAYGAFTSIFLLILLGRLFLDHTPYDRVIWGMFTAIFGVGILFCFSRGVWLSLFIALGFLFTRLGERERPIKFLFSAGAILLFLTLLSLPGVYDAIHHRAVTLFDLHFASNRSRLLRWGQAIVLFLKHPILGNGYGSFAALYEEDVSIVGAYTVQFQLGAHSEYLQVLAELGLVGFIAWMWILIAFFRYGFRALREIRSDFYRSLIVGMMAAELFVLMFCTVFTFPDGDEVSLPFWVIYGLLPAIVEIARGEREGQERVFEENET